MENEYYNSRIYSIRNNFNDEIYTGSTSSDLCKRMVKHRSVAKQEPLKSPFHTYMNENGIENFYIELVEDYNCENIEQLRKTGEIIREIGSLNHRMAGRPKQEYNKEYTENNRDQINQQRNERRRANPEKTKEECKRYGTLYRERHPEKIKAWHTTIVECECGRKYTLSHKAEHFKSKRHQAYEQQNNNILINNIENVSSSQEECEEK